MTIWQQNQIMKLVLLNFIAQELCPAKTAATQGLALSV